MTEAPVSGSAGPEPFTSGRLARDSSASALAFAFGVALCLRYGRIGLMPLDESIVFDGAWRVLSGQVPYRDFHTPTGLVPILMQAAFFRLLGTSWFAYVLHAALMNGAFALLAHVFLLGAGLGRLRALLFALLTAVVAYTPFGVPGADQHAFFFTLLSIALALGASRARERLACAAHWGAVPVALLLGLLSKQLPTLLAVPILAGILWAERPRRRLALKAFGAGFAGALLVTLGLGAAAGVTWERVWAFLVTLPGRQGLGRLRWLVPPRIAGRLLELPMPSLLVAPLPFLLLTPLVARRFGDRPGLGGALRLGPPIAPATCALVFASGLVSTARCERLLLMGVVLACLLAAAAAWLAPVRLGAALGDAALARGHGPLLLAAALYAVCLASIVLTLNESVSGVALVYLAAGLVCLGLERIATALSQQVAPARRLAAAFRGAAFGLTLLCAMEAAAFNARVNATRLVHIPRSAGGAASSGARIAPALAFMRWVDTPTATSADYANVVAFFRDHPGGFLLLGDSSLLYALTGRPSLNPCLWFHEGLATPRRGTPLFAWYESQLLENLRAVHARYVVLEGPETFMGFRLDHAPRLSALVRERGRVEATFGRFVILALEPPP